MGLPLRRKLSGQAAAKAEQWRFCARRSAPGEWSRREGRGSDGESRRPGAGAATGGDPQPPGRGKRGPHGARRGGMVQSRGERGEWNQRWGGGLLAGRRGRRKDARRGPGRGAQWFASRADARHLAALPSPPRSPPPRARRRRAGFRARRPQAGGDVPAARARGRAPRAPPAAPGPAPTPPAAASPSALIKTCEMERLARAAPFYLQHLSCC